MLILPQGHAQAAPLQRRGFTARERWILAGVLAAAAALVVAVVISLGMSDPKPGNGCIDVTAPGFIGSQEISGCGAHARAICRSAAGGGGYSRGQDEAIIAACRKQGIPVTR
jgi:hypothetical protein